MVLRRFRDVWGRSRAKEQLRRGGERQARLPAWLLGRFVQREVGEVPEVFGVERPE